MLNPKQARVTGGFWGERLEMNATQAIFHQWEQLEASGCIENFRIAAGQSDGLREGYFFADSDAYKWLEAASRVLADPARLGEAATRLKSLVDELVGLLEAVQMEDGYIYTYNQVHFPGQRWVNLQIEHELYCLGHLIEAAIAHQAATGEGRLLDVGRRAADLLVKDFMEAPPEMTDGHEEIELALIRLYRLTRHAPYLELPRRLLERRGRIRFFPIFMWRTFRHYQRRERQVEQRRQEYLEAHPGEPVFSLPPSNPAGRMRWAGLRQPISQLSGKYFQQHRPIRKQTAPVGHSVRFAYLETAATMLAQETGDEELRGTIEQAWVRMVEKRMYVSGGLGALPFIEGFGNDYELHPEYAYAETCAALGSLFWNRELQRQEEWPRYADLYEWQLYNAASVGMGLDGRTYLYNNPLTCRDGRVQRAAWYKCPCCPSNLSRAWANLGKALLEQQGDEVRLYQYISSEIGLERGRLKIESGLPWDGQVHLEFEVESSLELALSLRIPSWGNACRLSINGEELQAEIPPVPASRTACGYDPQQARLVKIQRTWQNADRLELQLDLPIRPYRQHPRLPACGGAVAVGRGPLVYCLETADNPGVDIFDVKIDPASLQPAWDPGLLGGVMKITGRTQAGESLTWIPYMLWGNRGPSLMTVFVRD